MKKFISMVMAAAMVVSLVPATAFAANAATFKVVDAVELTEEAADLKVKKALDTIVKDAEIQIKVTDVDTNNATPDKYDITLSFENAEAAKDIVDTVKDAEKEMTWSDMTVETMKTKNTAAKTLTLALDSTVDAEDDSFDFVLHAGVAENNLEEGDVIVIPVKELATKLGLVYTDDADVTVEVDGDFGTSDALTVVAVLEEGLKVTLKKVGEVAEEEEKALKSDLVIEAAVGTFAIGQRIELKLNNGFEWAKGVKDYAPAGLEVIEDECDDDLLVYEVVAVKGEAPAKITFSKTSMVIDAADAKVGDVAKITVKAKDNKETYAEKGETAVEVKDAWKDTVTVDAMEVIAEGVTISVEEDEDVPVMYSGAVAGTDFLNVDADDFMSLEVTIEESVLGALDVKKDVELMLTEGVYVTNVKVTKDEGVHVADDLADNGYAKLFQEAYKEGKHEGFVFDRKTFKATDDSSIPTSSQKEMEFKFKLELMAVPGFVGDVELTLDGPAFEEAQTVTIAKFVAPYTVEAAQNDMIIDYRNTEVPTTIVVKEAEAGLWNADKSPAKSMAFEFGVDYMTFEDDAVITVNEESAMEIDAKDELSFVVDEESDDEAAVVTISDIKLYMSRSLPAGAYDLELGTSAGEEMMQAKLYTAEKADLFKDKYTVADIAGWKLGKDGVITEPGVVKEGFINVITAGRDQDDASFTKKVVVTIGANEMVAGEETVALDVPAYINAAGRTMLPVRAVAVALGINTNNVIWDQATKTVTILYGQRIITMQVGSSVITVNGSAIPATAAVEIVDGRTFLGFRDLATALGVTDIVWTAETQQVTMNGNR